jgi:hypothetical protein
LKYVLALLLLSGGQTPSSVLPLWSDLTPGRHPVGYRTAETNISIWYPSADSGERLRFRDYIPALEVWDQFLHAQGIPDETIVELFDAPMFARQNAPAIDGEFPVIFIVQGNDQGAADQAVLAEFLASHGYVVATVPSPKITAEADLGARADEVARELERVARVTGRPYAIIGHSFGVRAMLRYAERNRMEVLINLDGIEPETALLRKLGSRHLRLTQSEDMRHVHFSTWGFIASAFPEIHRATKATERTRAAVTGTARRVLGFLLPVTSQN